MLRTLAATLGAYGVAVATTFGLVPVFTFLLSTPLSDAVYFSIMLGYVSFFAACIYAFSAASIKRLYLTLMLISLQFVVLHLAGGQA